MSCPWRDSRAGGGLQLGQDLPQPGQHRRQQAQLQKAAAADAEAQGGGLHALLQPGPGGPRQGQDLPGILGEQVPLLGQPHLLAGAVEQLHPQLVLQGVDLVAHRRLGQPQLLRRPGEVEKVGHRHEALQLGGIHTDDLLTPRRSGPGLIPAPRGGNTQKSRDRGAELLYNTEI